MTDEAKLINIGKAFVDMMTKIEKGDIKGTSLEKNIAFFEWDNQVYRMHVSHIEDNIIYSRGLHVVENEDSNEKLDETQIVESTKENGNDKV